MRSQHGSFRPLEARFWSFEGFRLPVRWNSRAIGLSKQASYTYFDEWEVTPERQAPLLDPGGSPLQENQRRRAAFCESFRPATDARRADGPADTRRHIRNFLDCVKSRATPNCEIESAHRATTTAIIANIAFKMRQHLSWDRENERFTNSPGANGFLHYEYRKP